jgi:hypothetical protein
MAAYSSQIENGNVLAKETSHISRRQRAPWPCHFVLHVRLVDFTSHRHRARLPTYVQCGQHRQVKRKKFTKPHARK